MSTHRSLGDAKEIEHIAIVRQLRMDIMSKSDEVQTFEAEAVAASAVKLCQIVLTSSDNIVAEVVPSLDSMRASLKPAGISLSDFRSAVRKSLKISEE